MAREHLVTARVEHRCDRPGRFEDCKRPARAHPAAEAEATMTRCSPRHWFAYYGQPGTSAPTCVRYGCDARNPNYDPDRDPYAGADR